MDEAALCRRAARDAVRDVDPDALRVRIESTLEDHSTAPGTLVVATARVVDPDAPREGGVAERAAGVQLIYGGLALIRDLAAAEPWAGRGADGDREGIAAADDGLTDSNLALLAADVAVARGFYLLARTDAAGKAVEVVRAFGRERTRARTGEPDPVDLEVRVFEMAVVAGATAVGADPTREQLSAAADLARETGPGLAGDPLPAFARPPDGDAVAAEPDGGDSPADGTDPEIGGADSSASAATDS
jgi:hypothetical protein